MIETRDEDLEAYLRSGETRAIGESGTGAYLYAPGFVDELTVTLKQYARLVADMRPVVTDHGRPLQAPVAPYASPYGSAYVGSGPANALGTEGTAPSEAERTYTQVVLNGYPAVGGLQLASFQLEEDSAFPMSSVVAQFAGEIIGRTIGAFSVNGTGSSQPTGVYQAGTASALSLTAATAVEINGASGKTELTSGSPAPATLQAMVAAMDPAYSPSWYMNQATFAALSAVTDTAGQPVIRPNGPRVLYGFPIVLAGELTSLTASTVSGPILADLGHAFYYRQGPTVVKRALERNADKLQVTYTSLHRFDIQPRDTRALVCLKPAAT